MGLDLVGLGSAIVDFAPSVIGVSLSRVKSFNPYAGGAVSNLLVAASRLGLRTRFLGCVGDDEFGTFIIDDFEKEGVDISYVKRVGGRATGISFYSVDEKGDRHYVFYRFPGYSDPEIMLGPEDIKTEYIAQSRIFHFSESILRKSPTRETVFAALRIARANRVSVSYDPNMREELWGDREELLRVQKRALSFTDIFLATRKEASLIAGGRSVEETANAALALGPSAVVIRGKSYYQVATKEASSRIPVFEVKAVDTSGAGDAFDAGLLTGLVKSWSLDKAVLLGAAVAALKVMVLGTRAGLPKMEEATKFIKERTGKVFESSF